MSVEPDDLQLIPRSVRDKLDRVGIKLHLKQWMCLSYAERRQLCDQACDSPAEVDRYRDNLEALIKSRAGSAPEELKR